MSKSKNKDVFVTMGASNHSSELRAQDDFYVTDPKMSELLMELEDFKGFIFDNSYGTGSLMIPFVKSNRYVVGVDVEKRDDLNAGFNNVFFDQMDFLSLTPESFKTLMSKRGIQPESVDFVFNPPYKKVLEFAEKSLSLLGNGCKMCMFARLHFLEGKKRRAFFDKYPPSRVYVSSSRVLCLKNGDENEAKRIGTSAVAYAWYVWDKKFDGTFPEETVLKWFN